MIQLADIKGLETNLNFDEDINPETPACDPLNTCEQSKDWIPFSFVELNSPNQKKRKNTACAQESIKVKSQSNGKFPCPNCKSVYNRYDNLMQHLKYVCNQKPRFKCPYCDYVTKRTFSVYCHVRCKHQDEKVGYVDVDDPSTTIIEPQ